MARIYETPVLEIASGATESNVLESEVYDADQLIVLAPAVLAENVKLQIAFGDDDYVDYDTTNFTAAGYRTFEASGLKYRLKANTGVAATRTFKVNKRVG